MKFTFCLVLAFVAVTSATHVKTCTELDPADDPKNIVKPCSRCDTKCIQKFFKQYSKCDIPCEPPAKKIHFKHCRVQFPNGNATVEFKDFTFDNVCGSVSEFYFNKKTKKVVLAVEFPSMTFFSSNSTIKYNRKAKEQIERCDKMSNKLGLITLTMVFPTTCDLKLKDAEVFTYIDDSAVTYELGPRIYEITGEANKELKYLLENISFDLQIFFARFGAPVMRKWIEFNICRFPKN